MYNWQWEKGLPIYWFSSREYKANLKRNKSWAYTVFNSWSVTGAANYRNGFVVEGELDLSNYLANFTKELPKKPVLYFDSSSKYPRTKLSLTPYKRCIKLSKATNIVLKEPAEIQKTGIDYVFITDDRGDKIYGITFQDFNQYFAGNLDSLCNSEYLGFKFKGTTKIVYSGKITFVYDEFGTISYFNTGIYKKPFILDNDLDLIINQTLPDPQLEELVSIYEMIDSKDKNVIRLGSAMAAGFNVSKWPLSFRCVFGVTNRWSWHENGGSSVLIKQMINTVKLRPCGNIDYFAQYINTLQEKYSEEDKALAKHFMKLLPDTKDFCVRAQSYYVDDLPFIPDEYK